MKHLIRLGGIARIVERVAAAILLLLGLAGCGIAQSLPALAESPGPRCPAEAITCAEVTQAGDAPSDQPVTFGEAFARGDVPKGAPITARDAKGHDLPLQVDARSTYLDGSLRFAVLSTELPQMAAGERRLVSLFRRTAESTARPAVAGASIKELRVELGLRTPQITEITLGNRVGHDLGIPFQAGESVSLTLGDESFTVPISGDRAGGYFTNYTKVAEAFVAQINGASHTYRAFKGTESYEKFWITTAEGHDRPFDVSVGYGGRAKIAVSQKQAFMPEERYVATFHPGDGPPAATWLAGPVVRESDYRVALRAEGGGAQHPHLAVRVHWRHYQASGAVRADVIVENDWAYVARPQNWTYAVTIFRDGAPVYRHASLTHYHHSRWHKLVWSEGWAEPFVRHNLPYLLRSGIVPHYDDQLVIPARVLDDDLNALAKSDTGPMGSALVTTYMPMTGGRPDIGPLPRWAVLYLLSMDQRERAVLIANADAGASMPMHYRDQLTGRPATLDDHPTMTTEFGEASPKDAFPAVTNGETPWSIDAAHHPSLFYVPYLITGDLFYLEEQQFWANWMLASVDPSYRDKGRGRLSQNQLRGQAWSLRTLGEAAVATPDADPLKAYFNTRLAYNMDWYVQRYAHNDNPLETSKLGIIDLGGEPSGKGSPWQQDFLFLTVGHLAEMEVPKAEEFARWLAKFTVGRWNSDALGFCHKMAPAYYINVRSAVSGVYFSDWATLFRENRESWDPDGGCPANFPFGYPDSPGGYVANSYAMLGLATDLHIPGAREAFLRLRKEAPIMVGKFAEDPTWDIVPARDQ
jgi:hypothetical protein